MASSSARSAEHVPAPSPGDPNEPRPESRPSGPLAARAAHETRVALRRMLHALRAVDDDNELSPTEASALARIAKNEAATASGLAAVEGVRPQSMAAVLAKLESRGLIHRSPDPTDGRRQLVTLAEPGRAVHEGNRSAREEWLSAAIAGECTQAEARTLLAAAQIVSRLAAPRRVPEQRPSGERASGERLPEQRRAR